MFLKEILVKKIYRRDTSKFLSTRWQDGSNISNFLSPITQLHKIFNHVSQNLTLVFLYISPLYKKRHASNILHTIVVYLWYKHGLKYTQFENENIANSELSTYLILNFFFFLITCILWTHEFLELIQSHMRICIVHVHLR